MSCGDLISLQSSVTPAGSNTVLLTCCTIGDRTFLYVTDQNANPMIVNNLYGFEINTNGLLTTLPGFPLFTGSPSIGIICVQVGSSNFLYVANITANTISAYIINADGSLTPIADFTSTTPTVISACQIGDATYLYSPNVANNTITVFLVNSNGSLTQVPGSPFSNIPGANNPIGSSCCSVGDRDFLYVANIVSGNLSGFSINSDGSLSALTGFPVAVGANPPIARCCTVGNSTFLYTTSSGDNTVSGFKINADGSLTTVPGSPFATGASPQDVHCCQVGAEQILYVANQGSSNISAFNIASDGSLTQLPNSPFAEPGTGPAGFVCCNIGDNQYFYVANQIGGGVAIFKVATPPIISPISLPNGVANEIYSSKLRQVSGLPPISWSITAGAMPRGLTLNSTTGEISGTPSRSGNFSFTVTATDVNDCSGDQEYTLTILAVGISLTKTATPPTFGKGGQIITYTYKITNTSEATLTIESLVDDLIGNISCGGTILSGASVTCNANYRVTSVDVARGRITNTATVTTTNGIAATTSLQIFKKVNNESEIIVADHVYDWLISSDTQKIRIDLSPND